METVCQWWANIVPGHSRDPELGSHILSPKPDRLHMRSQPGFCRHGGPGEEQADVLWGNCSPGLSSFCTDGQHLTLTGTSPVSSPRDEGFLGRKSWVRLGLTPQQRPMEVRPRPRWNWGPREPKPKPSDHGPSWTTCLLVSALDSKEEDVKGAHVHQKVD